MKGVVLLVLSVGPRECDVIVMSSPSGMEGIEMPRSCYDNDYGLYK